MSISTSYIEGFEFFPNSGHSPSSSGVSVKRGVVSLRYAPNEAALAPGQPAQKYSLAENLYVRTREFSPGALISWGFVQLIGETDIVDGQQLTFLEARVWDGAEALYWDGAAWSSAAATDFNTLADFNANLSAFVGTTIAIEVRLRTIDGQYTPTLSGVCLQWVGRKISFMREWIVDTLLRSLKDSIRPMTDYPIAYAGGSTVTLSDYPLDASWAITAVEAVYDDDADPDHAVDLLDSFDSGTGVITLTGVVAETKLWIVLRYAPQIAVTTSSDFFEGAKSPAILITMVSPRWGGKSIGARGPSVVDVTTLVPSGTVYPNPIPMIDIDVALATVAPTAQDLISLNESVGSWLDAHPVLRSRALDCKVKMYAGNVLDWNTAQDDLKDPRLASGTLMLRNVPMITDSDAGAADGGGTKVLGSVDAGDPSAPGVGFAVSSVNVSTSILGTGGSSSLTLSEE